MTGLHSLLLLFSNCLDGEGAGFVGLALSRSRKP